MERPSFIQSADTRLLLAKLKRMKSGEIVTYESLSEEVRSKITGASGALQSAKRAAERETTMRFAAVNGVGIKCMNDDEIVDFGVNATERIRKGARRSMRKLFGVKDYTALPPEKQIQLTVRQTMLAATAELTTEKAASKIGAIAGSRVGELPISETLALFQK
jgi:hypothetical protein